METDYLASGKHIFPSSQIAVNCCQWKHFFLQLDDIFQSIFVCRKHSFLFRVVFLPMETINEISGKSVSKDEPCSC